MAAPVVWLLSGHKLSLENTLNKFFKSSGQLFKVPTRSADGPARQNIKAAIFVHLNNRVRADFYRLYGAEEQLEKWCGQRLSGSDRTALKVPDTKELRKVFSVPRKQHNGEKFAVVQALGMVLYDWLNEIGVKGAILLSDPTVSGKETLRELKHLFWTNPTRVRKGRKDAREKTSQATKLREHRYTKRVTA